MGTKEFILSCAHLCNKQDYQDNFAVLERRPILENKDNFKSLLFSGYDIKSAEIALYKCIDIANSTCLTTGEVIDLIPRLAEIYNLRKK